MAKKFTTYPSSIHGFMEYWDDLIAQWLLKSYGSYPLSEQASFAGDLKIPNDSIDNRMPEPYWGDPENCSVVIMNYNSGPCLDSRHTYRTCANTPECMIHEVNKHKYSGFAKSFPLYRPLSPTELWFEDSIGRGWWQNQKTKWIADLIKGIESDKLPFAMEICAWHSDNWPGINKTNLKKHKALIEDRVLNVLLEAVKNSDFKVGLCFGKRIGTQLLDQYVPTRFSVIKSGINYKVYCFDEDYFIVNYWDDKNSRNRYPKSATDIL